MSATTEPMLFTRCIYIYRKGRTDVLLLQMDDTLHTNLHIAGILTRIVKWIEQHIEMSAGDTSTLNVPGFNHRGQEISSLTMTCVEGEEGYTLIVKAIVPQSRPKSFAEQLATRWGV